MIGVIASFAAAAVRVGTPLGFAALGETVAEKSGVINLSVEGAMLAGAFAAAAAGGMGSGVVAAILAGAGVAALFAFFAVAMRVDQIIAGTAVTLAVVGLTGVLAQRVWGVHGAGLSVPTMAAVPVPILSSIPVIGPSLFNQSLLTYLLYFSVPLTSALLFRTAFGRQLRAAGESPIAARAAGVSVDRVRWIAVIIGGCGAGAAGASLVLAQVGTFTERMSGGRGFIAIAIVALGRWNPNAVAAASLLFGAATALQYLFQASGSSAPYQLFVALPYLLALCVLAITVGRRRGPAALGQAL